MGCRLDTAEDETTFIVVDNLEMALILLYPNPLYLSRHSEGRLGSRTTSWGTALLAGRHNNDGWQGCQAIGRRFYRY